MAGVKWKMIFVAPMRATVHQFSAHGRFLNESAVYKQLVTSETIFDLCKTLPVYTLVRNIKR